MEIKLTKKDVEKHGSVHEYMWDKYPKGFGFSITRVEDDGSIVLFVAEWAKGTAGSRLICGVFNNETIY
tara:strand:+ start:282 stop:488 length:207 start_codon:yes stop_codon:yes gene_type:complete